MESSNLPFAQHFSKVRENPKWTIKFIFTIIIIIIYNFIIASSTNYEKIFKEKGLEGTELEQAKKFGQIGGVIGGTLSSVFEIAFIFAIILIILKIMKNRTKLKVIFSQTLSYKLIISLIALIVITIQFLTGVSTTEYSITSLNIFDKGNKVLSAFNLQILIGAYIFGVMLYNANLLSKKTTITWSLIYSVCVFFLTLITSL